MNYLKYLFYGIVQGFTEFLPISSTAHLKVFSELFGLQDPGSSLSAMIHIASVLAVLVYFGKDIRGLKGIHLKNNFIYKKRILISILIGSITIIFVGFVVKFIIPNLYEPYLRSNILIGIISIITSLLMYLSQITKSKNISIANHRFFDSFLIGIAQAFSIIPGVSRSGITITFALLLGWKRVDAAKFSFLLGIPVISLAAFVEIFISIQSNNFICYGPLLVALISAFITSYISIKFLIKYISFKGLKFFIFYKLFFGLMILLLEFSF